MRKWVLTIYGVIILEECRTVASLLRNVAFATTKEIVKKGISLPTIYYHHNRTPDGRCCVQFSSKVQKQNKYPVIIISGLLRISKIEVTDVQPIFF